MNQLSELKTSPLYSWATLPSNEYLKRLGILFFSVFAFLGAPIAFQTFDPLEQPIEFVLSASTGRCCFTYSQTHSGHSCRLGFTRNRVKSRQYRLHEHIEHNICIFPCDQAPGARLILHQYVAGAFVVVAIAIIRIYLGWQYIGNRLLSAAVEYEETGWYDGQVYIKPPEVLARDRCDRAVAAELRGEWPIPDTNQKKERHAFTARIAAAVDRRTGSCARRFLAGYWALTRSSRSSSS